MIFYSFSVVSKTKDQHATCLVWVNGPDSKNSEDLAREQVDQLGWNIASMEAASDTEKSDYFAPCPSLDAFERALQDGIAFRVLL